MKRVLRDAAVGHRRGPASPSSARRTCVGGVSPSLENSFPNSIFAREEAVQPLSSTMTFSYAFNFFSCFILLQAFAWHQCGCAHLFLFSSILSGNRSVHLSVVKLKKKWTLTLTVLRVLFPVSAWPINLAIQFTLLFSNVSLCFYRRLRTCFLFCC